MFHEGLDWSGFVPELIAVFIGAAIAFGTAMWWDRKKKGNELEDIRKDTLDSIKEEMKKMREELQKPNLGAEWIASTNQYKFEVAFLSRNALDSAIHSGNFSLLNTKLQIEISFAYSRIDYCNSLADQITRFYFSSLYTHDVKRAEDVINEMSKDLKNQYLALQKDIDSVLPVMKT